jgi:hypothetical protein
VIIGTCILNTGCQKTTDASTPPPTGGGNGGNPNPIVDSNLISMFVITDTTKTVGNDTTQKNVYLYDTQKRLTSWSYYGYDNTGRNINYSEIKKLAYNGTDTLPYKIVTTVVTYSGGIANPNSDSSYLFYNSDGSLSKLSKVSVLTASNSYVSFSYSNNKSIVSPVNIQNGVQVYTGSYDSVNNTHYINSGNIVSNIFTRTGVSTGSNPSYFFKNSSSAIYDLKLNPFKKLELLFQLQNNEKPAEQGHFGGRFTSQSNVVSYKDTALRGNGTTYYNFTVSYDYKSSGLPKVGHFKISGTGVYNINSVGRYYYYYTN